MKKLILAACAMANIAAFAQDWPNATTECRPGSRWWWLGSAVDEKNLAYNIEQYAKAGLGTLEVTPIYGVQGNEANEIPFLSEKWMQMLAYTYSQADKNGITVEMNNGTGWPFGGPEVSIEDAATKAVFIQMDITGGKTSRHKLSTGNPHDKLNKLMAYSNDGKTVKDLTGLVKNNIAEWTAPKGKWQLVALFTGKTGQQVKRAAPGGEGYVLDHLNSKAVANYLDKFDRAFSKSKVPYPKTFFNDSYEVYGADWTPSLLDEFEKRRGYKLQNHFPDFISTERTEKTRRLVTDYRLTLSEILLDNFLRPWTRWAHSHGSTTRNQAHGSPANLIDAYACVDIPECEGFGLSNFNIKGLRTDSLRKKNDSDISMLKYASSAAHITGKKLVSSETFTWLTEHFRTSLSQCKPDMDLMFVSGVNHMFFHGTPYSPREAAWPGWLFYASINMSPSNSIWRDAPAFFEYITRCQSFLQNGSPDSDFLLYLPIFDIWDELPGRMVAFDIHKMDRYAPKFISAVNSIINLGYDVDYISDALINKLETDNGMLVAAQKARYKAIIIPSAKLMPESTLKKLMSLANEGATIIFVGNYPESVPGYGNLDLRQAEFNKFKSTLQHNGNKGFNFGKGRIILAADYKTALENSGIEGEELRTLHGLHFIRRKLDDGQLYFVSCLQEKDINQIVTFNTAGKSWMLYNPINGEKGIINPVDMDEGKTGIRLQLRSGESLFVRSFNKPVTGVPQWNYITELPDTVSLQHGWKLEFIQSSPAITGTFEIDRPVSWTNLDIPSAKTNTGTARYSTEINLPDTKADSWILDLGDVRESARVYVNSKYAGTLWAVPFRIDIGQMLKTGKNLIEVEVTNLPANRIADMDRRQIKWRIFKNANMARLNGEKSDYSSWGTIPSGLNSNVFLIPVKYN